MQSEEMVLELEKRFRKSVKKDKAIHNAFLLVHSETLGIHLNVAEGSLGKANLNPDQPYFIASVGKLFTAVLTGILVERGKLSFEDPVAKFMDEDLLTDLHVYKGKNYTYDIKIKHLLNHTSGLPDYFEDKPKQGKPMIKLLLDEPDRSWSPKKVIRWSKENLNPKFPPEQGFHYSDTGYHVLGLIIEKVTSKPFHKALNDYIFTPLHMRNSFLLQHSEPLEKSNDPIADFYWQNKALTDYKSLSIDYAGGGIVAPSKDLLKFMKALVNQEIIHQDTLHKMKDWTKFTLGIDYGYGIMNIKTVPIFMPEKFNSWGNAGSTGSFMFYHPKLDTYFIGSLNQFRYHRKGIMLMLKLINTLDKF
jgi:D-alanyl-D-alanine carboxypeptidase